jgi:hypothetical protein
MDFISQISEEPRLYSLVNNLTVSNPGFRIESSNASLG